MVDRRHVLIGGGAAFLAGAGAVWSGIRRMESMVDYTAEITMLRPPLPAGPDLRDLIRFATLAANSHNTLAWTFRAAGNRIDILPDLTRATPVVDPDNHHLFVSIGCAAENLSVAAASRGMPGEVRFDPVTSALSYAYVAGAATETALSDAIPLRQSTRGPYDASTLTTAELGLLAVAASDPEVALILITDPAQMGKLADLIAAANTAQIEDPAFMTELKSWMRFNPRRALSTGDGLFSATSGNPNLPDWLGPTMVNWMFMPESDNDKTAAKITSSAGLAVFASAEEDPENWIKTGRACQRFALQATALGLKHAFLNQPVEVANYRAELAALIGMPGQRPDLVMRFGHGGMVIPILWSLIGLAAARQLGLPEDMAMPVAGMFLAGILGARAWVRHTSQPDPASGDP